MDVIARHERISEFARLASLEITSSDGVLPTIRAGRLPAGTVLYLAHTPNATLSEVAEVACAAEAAGFRG